MPELAPSASKKSNAISDLDITRVAQWVLWKYIKDNRKFPHQLNGKPSPSNDPETWTDFASVRDEKRIGFVFTEDDDFIGIDLDGCRDPETGVLTDWAQRIIKKLDAYTEVSPSGTGVKLYGKATKPWSYGRVQKLDGVESYGDKGPAIEPDDRGKFYAFTRDVLPDSKVEIADITDSLDWLAQEFGFTKQQRKKATRHEFWDYTGDEQIRNRIARERMREEFLAHPIRNDGSMACFRMARVAVRCGLSDSEALDAIDSVHCFDKDPHDNFTENRIRQARESNASGCDAVWRDFDDVKDDCESISSPGTLSDELASRGIETWTIRQLLDAELKHEFLVDKMIVKGMTGGLFGQSKTLKTSISIDFCVSLILGIPFLGEFSVPRTHRVLMFSVESGKVSIKETIRRVLSSKGIDPRTCEDQARFLPTWIPSTSNQADLKLLGRMIREWGVDVVIFDPTYFMIDGENQSNQAKQGQELRSLSQGVIDAGATPIFVDHVKLSSANAAEHKPLELSDVSGAAKSAFFRQWVLLSRQEKFNPDFPIHRLWMSYGGNHGWHGTKSLEIDESRGLSGERGWGTQVMSASEAIADKQSRREEQRQTERQNRAQRDADAALPILAGVSFNKSVLREKTKLNDERAKAVIQCWLANGLIEEQANLILRDNGRKYAGFTWTNTQPVNSVNLGG
ncbi:MAG: AAA family ATPase [Planctomycetota bacterium]